eukprot:GHVU01087218.1.p1 GENE.GHVU01087218.1~~GHVU01087218.1.p1  ORF type:complete len:545 (-),score=74.78 GHVU01087218.1:239-1873(-)
MEEAAWNNRKYGVSLHPQMVAVQDRNMQTVAFSQDTGQFMGPMSPPPQPLARQDRGPGNLAEVPRRGYRHQQGPLARMDKTPETGFKAARDFTWEEFNTDYQRRMQQTGVDTGRYYGLQPEQSSPPPRGVPSGSDPRYQSQQQMDAQQMQYMGGPTVMPTVVPQPQYGGGGSPMPSFYPGNAYGVQSPIPAVVPCMITYPGGTVPAQTMGPGGVGGRGGGMGGYQRGGPNLAGGMRAPASAPIGHPSPPEDYPPRYHYVDFERPDRSSDPRPTYPGARPPAPHTSFGASGWNTVERQLANVRRGLPPGDGKREPDVVPAAGGAVPFYEDAGHDPGGKIRRWRSRTATRGRGGNMARRDVMNFFGDGLSGPRQTPFKSMTDMAAYFSGLQPDDQTDLISLLLSCRKLEKQLDEQQVVIDMLEHDLRQAQETLRFPPEWKDLEVLDLSGLTTKDKAELPPSDLPLFLKGRVLLQQKEAALAKEQMAGKEAKKAEPSGATQVAKSGMPTLKLGGGAGGGTPGTISKPSAAIGVPRKMPGGLKPKFAM